MSVIQNGMMMTLAQSSSDGYLLWALVLLGATILLLFMELFVPSGGLIGILAGIAAIGSIVAFFQYDLTWGLVASGTYLILGPIIGVFGFRWWINSPLGRRMILGGDEPGAIDPDDDSPMSNAHAHKERQAQLRQLIGAQGVTVTPLRPVGVVKINGQRVDAMAESGMIDSGKAIAVVDVYDNQIKVREV
jgi:membrane-bound ClpP family serine protease